MQFLVRLAQAHEDFRKSELEACASLAGTNIDFVHYSDHSPFCIINLPSEAAAKALVSRSILSQGIYELWGQGDDHEALHANLRAKAFFLREAYQTCSFRFSLDAFQLKYSQSEQARIFESFSYFPWTGPIRMRDPDIAIGVFEVGARTDINPHPKQVYCGRFVAKSDRDAAVKLSLKTRRYISRTSMDAELSLVTANMALAAPGKILYDPFVGTGSFPVACAHFGAMALGSDIDGRAVRGADGKTIFGNFEQYGTTDSFFDVLIADLVHTPLRVGRYLDGILLDPPYGVREGPKVLGSRDGSTKQLVMIDGVPAHMRDGFIPPKRAYGFDDMMQDILHFAFSMLVDRGRLSMWMPTADDEDAELAIPKHPGLQLLHVSVQHFYKWSRRLLTYERKPDDCVDGELLGRQQERVQGPSNDINRFRRKFFQGFRDANGSKT